MYTCLSAHPCQDKFLGSHQAAERSKWTNSVTVKLEMATGNASNRAASRKARVYIFRDFVVKKYAQHLEPGDVVLDVAGGKGDLSWLLRNVDGLDSVVVDPRITKKNHILKSIRYLKENPDQARERAIPGLPSFQPLAALLPKLEDRENFVSPRNLRLLVNDDLVSAIKQYKLDKNKELWGKFWILATQKALEATPLGYREQALNEGQQIKGASDALETILSTKLILAFHPDQATDAAIDLARALKVPYCIVPCCVFPKEFPNRKLMDGSRVRTYSELINYLQDKHRLDICTEALSFHFSETSKNLALFSLPNSS